MKRKQLLKSAAKRLGVTMLAAAMIFGSLPANVYAEGEDTDYEVEAPAEEEEVEAAEETEKAVIDEETEAVEEVEEVAAEEAIEETTEEVEEETAAEEILTEGIKTEATTLTLPVTVYNDANTSPKSYSAKTGSVTSSEVTVKSDSSKSASIIADEDAITYGITMESGYSYVVEYNLCNITWDEAAETAVCEFVLPIPTGCDAKSARYTIDFGSTYFPVKASSSNTVTVACTYIKRYGLTQVAVEFKEGSGSNLDETIPDPSQVSIPQGPTTYQSKEGADGLIFRLYNVALTREPEKGGYDSWTDSMKNKSKTAAEVAQGFFFSKEFKEKNYTNEQFVKMLYETMFGRPADTDGFTYWVKMLNNGVSREYVYKGFAESSEFTKLCDTYKVERGTVTVTDYRDQNPKTTAFMSKLYTQVMGRKYDEKGIEYWCKEYITQEKDLDEIVKGFTNSKEFKARNLNDEEYVTLLYNFYLGREPEAAGLKYWMDQLKAGKSRDSILSGFSNSKEFSSLKASYGL